MFIANFGDEVIKPCWTEYADSPFTEEMIECRKVISAIYRPWRMKDGFPMQVPKPWLLGLIKTTLREKKGDNFTWGKVAMNYHPISLKRSYPESEDSDSSSEDQDKD